MKLLYVYKLNPQDPTELALRKWFPRFVPDFKSFCFPFADKRRTEGEGSIHPGLRAAVESYGPSHVFCWVPYFNHQEIAWLKARKIKVSMAVNGATALTSGIIPDQQKFLAALRELDCFFVPHRPHVAPLRAAGVNALELPFCFDPEQYRPLPAWARMGQRLMPPLLFIGNFGDGENLQGQYRAQVIQALLKGAPVAMVCDAKFKEHGLAGAAGLLRLPTLTSPALINIALNLVPVSVGTDYFPNIEIYQKHYQNVSIPYSFERDCHVMRPRTYWSMGAGACFMVERYDEILRFFEAGKEIVVWKNLEDAAEWAARLSRDHALRAAIAAAGLKRVLSRDTAAHRVQEIARHLK